MVSPMLRSRDLQHWEAVGPVLAPPAEEQGGSFWAFKLPKTVASR